MGKPIRERQISKIVLKKIKTRVSEVEREREIFPVPRPHVVHVISSQPIDYCFHRKEVSWEGGSATMSILFTYILYRYCNCMSHSALQYSVTVKSQV
jgi:hypothetical protein